MILAFGVTTLLGGALNRARIISRILNAIPHVFQSDAVWAPC
jgi:hypothetical protein